MSIGIFDKNLSFLCMLLIGCVGLCGAGVALGADFTPFPDTGQHKCYDQDGNLIVCPAPGDSMAQDGSYDADQGKVQQAFTDNGDGTVTDNNTGLMWQQATADINKDNVIDDNDKRNWQEAKNECENLSFAGYSDWRLPSLFELTTIVDYDRFNPAINSVFSCESSYYWSSGSYTNGASSAWFVNFFYGYDGWDDQSNSYYVRCVRGGL